MKKLTVGLMIVALALAWVPVSHASCCAPQAAQEQATLSASCCEDMPAPCPMQVRGCELAPSAAMTAVLNTSATTFQVALRPVSLEAGAVTPSFTVSPTTFHQEDRAFPEAIFSLTKTYRL